MDSISWAGMGCTTLKAEILSKLVYSFSVIQINVIFFFLKESTHTDYNLGFKVWNIIAQPRSFIKIKMDDYVKTHSQDHLIKTVHNYRLVEQDRFCKQFSSRFKVLYKSKDTEWLGSRSVFSNWSWAKDSLPHTISNMNSRWVIIT